MKLLAQANPFPHDDLADAAHGVYAQELLQRLLASPRSKRGPSSGSGTQPTPEVLSAPVALVLNPGSSVAGARQGSVWVRPTGRRVVLLAGAAGVVAVAGAAVTAAWGPDQTALAATPPVLAYTVPAGTSGAAGLRAIAASTAAQPGLIRGGAYVYLRSEGWGLHTAAGAGTATSVLVPTQREAWIAADGQGRSLTTVGDSLRSRIGNRATLDAALARPGTSDRTFTRGGNGVAEPLETSTLPWTDASAFIAAVEGGTPPTTSVGARLLQAVDHLFARQPLDPATRAQVWNLVATVPGITNRGPLTDRLGRSGLAFTLDDDGSLNGLPTQLLLIIDPRDGQLLETDQVLTRSAGKLNVAIPAVTSVQINIAGGYTATDHQRPTP